MMKKALALLLSAPLVLPLSAEAGRHSWFHDHAAAEDCPVAWVEKTVTAYHTEYQTQIVPTVVTRSVSRVVEEPYKYTELVPVTVAEKRSITSYQCVSRPVSYNYTVNVPVVTQEKRTITTLVTVARPVTYTYTVNVPVVIPETRTVTTYIKVPEEVTHQKPVHKLARVEVVDACTGCTHKSLKHITEWHEVKEVVWHKVPVTKEIVVNVCSYRPEVRTATRLVHEQVPQTKEILVDVHSYRPETRTATYTVTEKVPVTREITVNVLKYEPVERTAVRQRVVCEKVQETIPVKQIHAVQVPHTVTIKVPVHALPACP